MQLPTNTSTLFRPSAQPFPDSGRHLAHSLPNFLSYRAALGHNRSSGVSTIRHGRDEWYLSFPSVNVTSLLTQDLVAQFARCRSELFATPKQLVWGRTFSTGKVRHVQ